MLCLCCRSFVVAVVVVEVTRQVFLLTGLRGGEEINGCRCCHCCILHSFSEGEIFAMVW